jgi:hypothetical protein
VQSFLLLQRRDKDGKRLFEVDSLRSAILKLKEENPNKNPHSILTATDLPSVLGELEDRKASAQSAYLTKKASSFDALAKEARAGDLLLEAEDEDFLNNMVEEGSPIQSVASPQVDARMERMENAIMQLLQAREVRSNPATAQNYLPPTKDPYDTQDINPDPDLPEGLTDEEMEMSDLFEEDLPDAIDLADALYQEQVAEREEEDARTLKSKRVDKAKKASEDKQEKGKRQTAAQKRMANARAAKKKKSTKAAPTAEDAKTVTKKVGRRKRGVPKIGQD